MEERRKKERRQEGCLFLTAEEAVGLLDIAILCPGDFTPEQRAAIAKLGELYRQVMQESSEEEKSAALPPLQLVAASRYAA